MNSYSSIGFLAETFRALAKNLDMRNELPSFGLLRPSDPPQASTRCPWESSAWVVRIWPHTLTP